MEKKDAIFLLALLGAGGYALHANWDTIKVKLGLDDLRPGRIRAMHLAKEGNQFDAYRTNWMVVKGREENGEIKVSGDPWNAAEVANPRYRVTCTYVENGERRVHVFSVDIASAVVTYEGLEAHPAAPQRPGASPR